MKKKSLMTLSLAALVGAGASHAALSGNGVTTEPVRVDVAEPADDILWDAVIQKTAHLRSNDQAHGSGGHGSDGSSAGGDGSDGSGASGSGASGSGASGSGAGSGGSGSGQGHAALELESLDYLTGGVGAALG